MDESSSPWLPKIPSTTGEPKKAALEHKVAYRRAGCLEGSRRRYSARARPQQPSCSAVDTARICHVCRRISPLNSMRKD